MLDAHSAGASDDPLAARPAVIANVSGATSALAGVWYGDGVSLDMADDATRCGPREVPDTSRRSGAEFGEDAPRPGYFIGRRGIDLVGDGNLTGMDHGLAVHPEQPALLAFLPEAGFVAEVVIDAVENIESLGSCRDHVRLQRE